MKTAHKERLNSQTDGVKEGEKTDKIADTHSPQPLQTPQRPPATTPHIPYPIRIGSLYEAILTDSKEREESDLKRKLTEEPEDINENESEKKRPRTIDVTTAAMTELTKAINKDREERERERQTREKENEMLTNAGHKRRKSHCSRERSGFVLLCSSDVHRMFLGRSLLNPERSHCPGIPRISMGGGGGGGGGGG